MHLVRLLYVSEAPKKQGLELDRILKTAVETNRKNNVTGMLWFTGKYFIQILEGARPTVSQTYHRIAADPRHESIELLWFDTIDERMFTEWNMGYFGETPKNVKLLSKYSAETRFNPKSMNPISLLKLMSTLSLS